MQSSIVFATLIILLFVLPLFGLTGIEGRLPQPLALGYGVELTACKRMDSLAPHIRSFTEPAASPENRHLLR